MSLENNLIKESFTPNSAFIISVEYSYVPKNDIRMFERLRFKFTDGRDYEYSTIVIGHMPDIDWVNFNMQSLFERIKTEESVGRFWSRNINYKLQFNKVNGSK